MATQASSDSNGSWNTCRKSSTPSRTPTCLIPDLGSTYSQCFHLAWTHQYCLSFSPPFVYRLVNSLPRLAALHLIQQQQRNRAACHLYIDGITTQSPNGQSQQLHIDVKQHWGRDGSDKSAEDPMSPSEAEPLLNHALNSQSSPQEPAKQHTMVGGSKSR